ncbi:MAG TPA: carbohydrate binding family 9 domain-containing protein, partial [bacterium]|nr:carbohydrate binding family 9 domain-containing protein [bacterium]
MSRTRPVPARVRRAAVIAWGVASLFALGAVLPSAATAREIRAVRAVDPPVLDGSLDDACWADAAPSGGFHLRQGDGDLPTQETFVRVCYDDEHLYVGFECHEDDMENLSAAIAHRDADALSEDDTAVLSLDTYHDGRSSYVLLCTPLGTKKDFHTSECGRSYDVGWDAVWAVETDRLEDRWIAEFSIPFSELRYRAGDDMVWGIDFRRSEHPHREFSSWSNPDGPTHDPSYFGDLVGLSGIKASRGVRLMPFVMGKYDVSNLYDYPLEPDDS